MHCLPQCPGTPGTPEPSGTSSTGSPSPGHTLEPEPDTRYPEVRGLCACVCPHTLRAQLCLPLPEPPAWLFVLGALLLALCPYFSFHSPPPEEGLLTAYNLGPSGDGGGAWAGRAAGTVAPVNFPPCPWAGCLLGQANIFTKIKTKNVTFRLRLQISGGSTQAEARMRPISLTKPWRCSHKDQVNNVRSETVTFFNTGSSGNKRRAA